MIKYFISIIFLAISLVAVSPTTFAYDTVVGGLCPIVVNADQVKNHKPNTPIPAQAIKGPHAGEQLELYLQKDEPFSLVKPGDVVVIHGEVHKIMDIKKSGNQITLGLKRTGIGVEVKPPYKKQ